MNYPSMTASADISPCRFIKISGDFRVAQAVANDFALAISREYVRDVPQTGGSGLAAKVGEPVQALYEGEVGEIEVGAAVTAGGWAKPDANGRAIPCTSGIASAYVLRGQSVVGNRALVVVKNATLP